jgi:hypothetical protein
MLLACKAGKTRNDKTILVELHVSAGAYELRILRSTDSGTDLAASNFELRLIEPHKNWHTAIRDYEITCFLVC